MKMNLKLLLWCVTYYFAYQVDLEILVFLLSFGQVQIELVSIQNQSLQRIQRQNIAKCWIDFTRLQILGESLVWVILYEFYSTSIRALPNDPFLLKYHSRVLDEISIFSPGNNDSSGISNLSFQVLPFLLSMLLTYSHFPVLDFASVKLFHLEIRIDWLLQQWSWLQLHPEYFVWMTL